jgi:hypothetical protein
MLEKQRGFFGLFLHQHGILLSRSEGLQMGGTDNQSWD